MTSFGQSISEILGFSMTVYRMGIVFLATFFLSLFVLFRAIGSQFLEVGSYQTKLVMSLLILIAVIGFFLTMFGVYKDVKMKVALNSKESRKYSPDRDPDTDK